jgi:serine/threonine-protein kinase HipA
VTQTLLAQLDGRTVGRVQRLRTGGLRFSFTYDDAWRNDADAYPLSLSMPLSASEHRHPIIEAFLWGLLPDNEIILDRWAKRFHVSPRNAFALIAEVGEDCAGAVQFIRPERLADGASPDPEPEWLDEKAIGDRLRALRADISATRLPRDTGQFSLPGAQAKTALLLDGGRWGVPSGRTPTTHILKPPMGDLDGHAENEHFCLALARRLGLASASSEICRFDGEVAIVVERFDRERTAQGLQRIHQEDMCQALALPPTGKYENEGGPGAMKIIELLRTHSSASDEDIPTFIEALIFNWLIGGSDAHAKNYSLLLGRRGTVRLAPLYDLASALPYDQIDEHKLKLAMKIGGEYLLHDIGPRQWRKFAPAAGLDGDALIGQVDRMIERLPTEARAVRSEATAHGLNHPILDRLVERLSRRSEACRKMLSFAR